MKTLTLGLLMASSLITNSNAQESFKILNISAPKVTAKFICRAGGGHHTAPSITITHSKIGDVTLKVKLLDRYSNGGSGYHLNTSFKSSPTGKTILTSSDLAKAGLIPLCNTSAHDFTSTYSWIVEAENSSKEVIWGKIKGGVIQ